MGGSGTAMVKTTCEPMVTVGGATPLLNPAASGVCTVVVSVMGP